MNEHERNSKDSEYYVEPSLNVVPGGPRQVFGRKEGGKDKEHFLVIGSYANSNWIDTQDRTLKIYQGVENKTLKVELVNLPNASAAPPDADLETLVIDKKTGRLYVQQ